MGSLNRLTFAAISYKQYRKHRDQLSWYIKISLQQGEISLKEVEASIKAHQRLPVVIRNELGVVGFMTLELDGEAVHITTLAGTLPKGWAKQVYRFLVKLAKTQDRRVLSCAGRKGWFRKLKEFDPAFDGRLIKVEF